MITSGSNQHIALLRALHTPRGRAEHGAFLLEGPHLLEAALHAGVVPQLIVYDPADLERSADGRKTLGQIEEARAQGAEIYDAAPAAIERGADTRSPQGVLAAVAAGEVAPEKVRARRRGRMRPLLLVLDAIGDPGNLGTILRSALAADVDELLLTPGCADPLNPKVVRAGAGAHFHLPVREARDWKDVQQALRGSPAVKQVLAATADGHTHYDSLDLTQRTALLIGNEAHGVSAEGLRLATAQVSIPMWNRVESLNAAVAASVIVFEAARQRRAAEAEQDTDAHR